MNSITSPLHAIDILDQVRIAISQSDAINHVRTFRNQAEAIRHYMKSAAASLDCQNRAAEVKLIAERKLGELLANVCHRGGNHKSTGFRGELEKLGISRMQSHRCQLEASVPEEDFQRFVREMNAKGKELTSNALIHFAKLQSPDSRRKTDTKNPFAPLIASLNSLARQGRQFGCIYADLPWSLGNSKAEIARLPKRLVSLPVRPIVASNAHLHLWVPPEMLEIGLMILRAWSFRYKDMLVRQKPSRDYGSYWHHAHDVLLLGVRGRLEFRDSGLPSFICRHETNSHVDLADMYSVIARVSPPPYLSLFESSVPTGWTSGSPA